MWRLKHENKQTQKQTNKQQRGDAIPCDVSNVKTETPHVASLQNIYIWTIGIKCVYIDYFCTMFFR
jgi:hypothetical protein